MLIGNPLKFAVEIYHEPHSLEWLGFGGCACTLPALLSVTWPKSIVRSSTRWNAFANLERTMDSLWDERLSGHTDVEIFAWLDHELYTGESAISSSNLVQFDFLTNTGEQFDASKSFIYCQSDGSVHILFDGRDGISNSLVCESSEFKRQAHDLEVWFAQQTKKALMTSMKFTNGTLCHFSFNLNRDD